jgi:S-DNA-T family DNA segregation ATPase FtsK/SpoIIIE
MAARTAHHDDRDECDFPLEPPHATESAGRSRGREFAGLLLLALGLFLLLGLVTFQRDPLDPTVVGANWVGPVGEAACGWIVQGFGLVALLAPIELAVVGLKLLRSRDVGTIGFRLAADLSLGIVLSAVAQILFPESTSFGSMRLAGNVGWLFGELSRSLFSSIGTLLVATTLVGILLLARSPYPFTEACERTVRITLRIAVALQQAVVRLHAAWVHARSLRSHPVEKAQAYPAIHSRPSDDAIIAELSADEANSVWNDDDAERPSAITLGDNLRCSMAPTTEQLLDTLTPASVAVAVDSVPRKPKKPPEAPVGVAEEQDDEEEIEDEEEINEEEIEDDEPEPELEVMPLRRMPKVSPKKAPEGPRIVDTRPAQQTKRAEKPQPRKVGQFRLPSTELLSPAQTNLQKIDEKRILEHARRLEKTLADYGVTAKVEEIHPGPTVTTYEVSAQAGTKVSKVASLADDLALGLSRKVRIIAPIPGKSRIGFELPNDDRIAVNLRELVEDQRFQALADRAPLPVVLGRDIVGAPFYADLASLPHVIVAGATGAGKSVGLNVMLASLLFRRSPDELRLLMIDPKVVELAPFDKIPHLLLPVVTDMKQATVALRWAVDEMERRYQLFATAGTKNITTYNRWVERVVAGQVPPPAKDQVDAITADGAVVSVPSATDGADGASLPGKLPYIVVVIDEFADLIMQQGKEVESAVARLAQKARAAGLHVVLATQRPSVDVITGMIKANFPSRIAYLVAQKVDSRTILDEQGAEMLLGKGDMLVKLNGSNETRRVQCPFISEDEVSALTDYLRTQGTPNYHEAILQACEEEQDGDQEEEKLDPRFDEAVRIVAETQRCSTSWLQRKMTIGYNRAAKIVEAMENRGIVGPPNGAKDRQVLISPI